MFKTITSEFNPWRWRKILLALTVAAVTTVPALAQTNVAKGVDEGEYSTWDIGGFFGTQWFQMYQERNDQNHLLLTRPIVGVRFGQDPGRYVGIEESFSVGFNRLAMLPYGGSGYATVRETNYQIAVHGLLYITPRTSRYRPFLYVGPTMVIYQPGSAGSIQVPTVGVPTIVPASLATKIEPGADYGIGLKMPLAKKWEARIDLMGLYTPTPDFGLPGQPGPVGSLSISTHRGENAWQFTAELGYKGGWHEPPPPPAAAPPPPPPPAPITVSAIQGAHDVCPGDNLRLSVSARGGTGELSYQWYINGSPAAGGTGTSFNVPTANESGTQSVYVKVSAGTQSANSDTASIRVRNAGPPTVSFTVSPSTINYGDRLPLNATARVSECSTETPIRYTASEGTITGNTYDSSGVSFDPNNPAVQTKTVTLTATETDSRNQTASATANVTVTKKANATRQDIVFPNRSSRVNNAAKRYLLEVLTPKLQADPGSTVILIGHRDSGETGRAAANLDHERVYNAAAVISAGKGICPSLDLSRVQVAYAGTDQTDTPMPFGDASVKERAGQAATGQNAQFRRVEVWFIPSGADRPNVPGVMPAPTKEIQAKGCPR